MLISQSISSTTCKTPINFLFDKEMGLSISISIDIVGGKTIARGQKLTSDT